MRSIFAAVLMIATLADIAFAQARVSRVIPSLEIEILDPNVDARGNPGVIVGQDASGQTQVDIAFRGPDLPGGPSIIVAFHPKSGQKVYLPVQMLPGSPMVTYTAQSIEYDFGDRAVLVSFPRFGNPKVVYRNGRSFTDRLGNLVHWDKVKGVFASHRDSDQPSRMQEISEGTQTFAKPLVLPLQNMARYVPGVTPFMDSKVGGHSQARQETTKGTYLPEP
jgi:hypothetical protein